MSFAGLLFLGRKGFKAEEEKRRRRGRREERNKQIPQA